MVTTHHSRSINPTIKKKAPRLTQRAQFTQTRPKPARKLADPFNGSYECQPFAQTTQGATNKEISADITAINAGIIAVKAAGIIAVNARQPIKASGTGFKMATDKTANERAKMRARRAVSDSSDEEPTTKTNTRARKAPDRAATRVESPGAQSSMRDGPYINVKPHSRVLATTPPEIQGSPTPKQFCRPFTPEQTESPAADVDDTNKAEGSADDEDAEPMVAPRRARGRPRSKPAGKLTAKPTKSPAADISDASETVYKGSTFQEEAEPIAAPRRAPKRAARNKVVEQSDDDDTWDSITVSQEEAGPPAKKAKKTKKAEAETARELVKKNLMNYFGPRGRRN